MPGPDATDVERAAWYWAAWTRRRNRGAHGRQDGRDRQLAAERDARVMAVREAIATTTHSDVAFLDDDAVAALVAEGYPEPYPEY